MLLSTPRHLELAVKTRAQLFKLTTSLVKDSLKFQMAILQIHCYFCLKNERILCVAKILIFFFSTKHISVFAFEVDI